jgi:hypothetical protein
VKFQQGDAVIVDGDIYYYVCNKGCKGSLFSLRRDGCSDFRILKIKEIRKMQRGFWEWHGVGNVWWKQNVDGKCVRATYATDCFGGYTSIPLYRYA